MSATCKTCRWWGPSFDDEDKQSECFTHAYCDNTEVVSFLLILDKSEAAKREPQETPAHLFPSFIPPSTFHCLHHEPKEPDADRN